MSVSHANAVVQPVNCHAFTASVTAYSDCVGLGSGNTSVDSANAAFSGGLQFSVEYKDNQTGPGSDTAVFDLLDNDNDSVTLKFLQNIGDGTGSALIALKFGGQGTNQLGYFRFDFADFDIGETLTFSWNQSFRGDGISHASIFSNVIGGGTEENDVPEPATYALILAGLAASGLARRRSRR